MSILTIDTISFNQDELDYESNGGSPVILSSFSGIQVFDSYLISGGVEYKLYRPTPTNILFSYKVNLICSREKIREINSLIFKQSQLVKDYRKSGDSNSLQGYLFQYSNEFNTRIWLTSFSLNGSYFDVDSQTEKVRCSLDLQESE